MEQFDKHRCRCIIMHQLPLVSRGAPVCRGLWSSLDTTRAPEQTKTTPGAESRPSGHHLTVSYAPAMHWYRPWPWHWHCQWAFLPDLFIVVKERSILKNWGYLNRIEDLLAKNKSTNLREMRSAIQESSCSKWYLTLKLYLEYRNKYFDQINNVENKY